MQDVETESPSVREQMEDMGISDPASRRDFLAGLVENGEISPDAVMDSAVAESEARLSGERGMVELRNEIAAGNEICDEIEKILDSGVEKLTEADIEKIKALRPRIEMVLSTKAKLVSEAMEHYHEDSLDALSERIYSLREITVPLFAEVGDTGGWAITPQGYRNWWAGDKDQAESAAYQYKNMQDIVEKDGGELMMGKTSDAAKLEVFKALGVVEGDETLLEAVSRHSNKDGKGFKIWDEDYDVIMDTNTEGVKVRVAYRSARRSSGMGAENFEATLIFKH